MREFTDPNLHAAVNWLTVGGAAGVARLSVHGYSVLKIWAQSGAPGGKMGPATAATWIYHLRGMKGFLRGATVSAGKAVPHYGITFAVYDRVFNTYFQKPSTDKMPLLALDPKTIFGFYISGAIGGATATLVTHPADVVKTRLVLDPQPPKLRPQYSGSVDAFRQIWQNEGLFRGLYRGLGLSVVGSATFWGVTMTSVQLVQSMPWLPHRPFMPFEEFFWAFAAVGGAVVATQPLDVLRRKYMAQSYVLPKEGGVDVRFKNIQQLIVGIYKVNGVYGFAHGFMANAFKIIPQVTVFWIVLCGSQLMLSGRTSQSAVA